MPQSKSLLKQLARELISEEKIGASPEYMRKEHVRQTLQDLVVKAVKSGEIGSQEQLAEFFDSVDMAVKALKMVPIGVYEKMAQKTRG